MSSSYTFSGTESYSVADVKGVMQNTYEDIIGFANRGFITYEGAKHWIEELTYVLNKRVVKFFEIQLYHGSTWYKTFRYTVDAYGYLTTGSPSGGINFYSLPAGTQAILFVDLDFSNPDAGRVNEELRRRGWGIGSATEGNSTYQRSYTSNNLQLKRSEINK